jgi:hypothetical protein
VDAFTIGSKGIAILFLLTAVAKIQKGEPFLGLMGRLGLSGKKSHVCYGILVAFELALALIWWSGWQLQVFGLVTTFVFLFFALILEMLWRRGHRESCGCYGGLAKVNPRQGVRLNLIYAALAIFVWTELPS